MSLHKSDFETFNLVVEQGESVIILHQMVFSLILYSFNVKLLLVLAFASLIFFSFNGPQFRIARTTSTDLTKYILYCLRYLI